MREYLEFADLAEDFDDVESETETVVREIARQFGFEEKFAEF